MDGLAEGLCELASLVLGHFFAWLIPAAYRAIRHGVPGFSFGASFVPTTTVIKVGIPPFI